MQACCPIVELRQYTLYPGMRDELITLFEQRFIESQEEVGIQIVGQFRDINDANRYVWVRGFEDMESRRKALGDFYFGPVWQAYRTQANATLYDSDNVLLLRPAASSSGFVVDPARRRPAGDEAIRGEFVVATIYSFEGEVPRGFVDQFERELIPLFERSGAKVLARYVSEKGKNTFERLPVREKDNVFVWFASFADRAAYERHIEMLAREDLWRTKLFADLHRVLCKPPEVLMLQPTARSLVGH